ncbi:hypothetical protein BJG93_14325 [Paraburkholderia sprentiae WSM5005]|uniref:Uncharacterized protein n=1 Tax=Paraburkholderia sprentiae WSM5005 TaxID=754502 RepID=A0A1I9YJF7_9BURK|nr:hypothetical protein [Paraburkholderia sprentiae]APA86440.1 hypothetical protein BJG93_14325 [Paraburkholderia sprentiae WSM5005]
MSLARRVSPLLPSLLPRIALACGAALLFTNAVDAAQTTEQNQPADICAALTHIVDASDFQQLSRESAAQLPGVSNADDCRASPHAYDCHWRAHWQADGAIDDPLEELGADIAACFPRVVHDVNTPVRQHFVVTTDARRVSVTASVQGHNELRLRVTR